MTIYKFAKEYLSLFVWWPAKQNWALSNTNCQDVTPFWVSATCNLCIFHVSNVVFCCFFFCFLINYHILVLSRLIVIPVNLSMKGSKMFIDEDKLLIGYLKKVSCQLFSTKWHIFFLFSSWFLLFFFFPDVLVSNGSCKCTGLIRVSNQCYRSERESWCGNLLINIFFDGNLVCFGFLFLTSCKIYHLPKCTFSHYR